MRSCAVNKQTKKSFSEKHLHSHEFKGLNWSKKNNHNTLAKHQNYEKHKCAQIYF